MTKLYDKDIVHLGVRQSVVRHLFRTPVYNCTLPYNIPFLPLVKSLLYHRSKSATKQTWLKSKKWTDGMCMITPYM